MTQIVLPKTLAKLTEGQANLQVKGGSLFENLQTLTKTYALDDALLDRAGCVQPYIRMVMGDQLVTASTPDELQAIETEGQTVLIKTAFAGG